MYIILLQNLQRKFHYVLVRASKLTEECIKTNSGPQNSSRNYVFKKVVQASHHQDNSKYGESAGMHCTSNAYFVSFFPIKSIDIWKTFDLDYILKQGEYLKMLAYFRSG